MSVSLPEHLIWLTRGRDWGFRFLSLGPFSPELVDELYKKVFGENGDGAKEVAGTITIAHGEQDYHYAAYRFYDQCHEWRDVAGRAIPHEMIVVHESARIECSAKELMDCVRPFYARQFVKKNEEVELLSNCLFDLRMGTVTKAKEECNIKIEGCRPKMAWNRPTQKIESECKTAKRSRVWWGLGAGLIVALAAVAGAVSFSAGAGRPRPEKTAADEEVAEAEPKPKQSRTIREVTPAAAPRYNVVAEKLQGCKFLVNGQVKQKAKVYLCLFSASWCPPCRAEMPRIAKTYAETLKDDPDIELIHFSCDRDDTKAMAWAKEHDVKFPVVKPKGGNPLDLHTRGIPHLFIVKDDGTLLEEGHPMRLFTEEKLRTLTAN